MRNKMWLSVLVLVGMTMFSLGLNADDQRGKGEQSNPMGWLTPEKMKAMQYILEHRYDNIAVGFKLWKKMNECQNKVFECMAELEEEKYNKAISNYDGVGLVLSSHLYQWEESKVVECVKKKVSGCNGYSVCSNQDKKLDFLGITTFDCGVVTYPEKCNQKMSWDYYCEEGKNEKQIVAKCAVQANVPYDETMLYHYKDKDANDPEEVYLPTMLMCLSVGGHPIWFIFTSIMKQGENFECIIKSKAGDTVTNTYDPVTVFKDPDIDLPIPNQVNPQYQMHLKKLEHVPLPMGEGGGGYTPFCEVNYTIEKK